MIDSDGSTCSLPIKKDVGEVLKTGPSLNGHLSRRWLMWPHSFYFIREDSLGEGTSYFEPLTLENKMKMRLRAGRTAALPNVFHLK